MHGKLLAASAMATAVMAAAVSPMSDAVKARACSPAFKNIVFNSGVNDQPDIVGRLQTIKSYGVDKWIGFTLGNASPESPVLNDNQIKMVVSGADIQAGVDLVTGPNAPEYLGILNEPDGGFYDLPVYSPEEAAGLVQPFLDAQTSTTYLSPAPAYPYSDWLPRFFEACQCADRFPVILAHVYSVDAQGAIGLIQGVMDQFPGKTIWVTEISPASDPAQNCGLDNQGVAAWMNEVIGWAAQQPVVERIFWNCGEWGTLYPDPNQCNPSLTNFDGSPTALLEAFGQICAA